nr:MAG TPA: hypothetical protein [Siphoviridae sp. ctcOR4]
MLARWSAQRTTVPTKTVRNTGRKQKTCSQAY